MSPGTGYILKTDPL
jgi:hypothetical protein